MLLMYSKPNCPQCVKLENVLTTKGYSFDIKKLGEDYDRDFLVKLFEDLGLPLPRAFPLLFKEGVYLGSLTEAMNLINNDEL